MGYVFCAYIYVITICDFDLYMKAYFLNHLVYSPKALEELGHYRLLRLVNELDLVSSLP